MKSDDLERLALIYDHYKDTFGHILEREEKRNKLFYQLIILLGLLFVEVLYPLNLNQLLSASANPISINLQAIPGHVILSATWVFLIVVTLRYCQLSIHVERQYSYLHNLEEKVGGYLKAKDFFCREGKAYQENYPLFAWWAWFSYTIMFPVIAVASLVTLIYFEKRNPSFFAVHYYFHVIAAISVFLSIFFYRFWPVVRDLFKKAARQEPETVSPEIATER
jgi:amino acid transporter